MAEREEIAATPQPTRRLLIAVLLVWGVLAFALPLAALTLNGVKFAAFPLGYWLTAFGCPILLAGLALIFQRRAAGDHHGEGFAKSLPMAAEVLGAPGVLGFAAAIAALGFDGLSYSLGLVAGLALMCILIAPRLSLYPRQTVTDFFDERFGGCWPRRMALLVIAVSTVFLLAANLRGAALVTQGLIASDYGTALAFVTVVLSVVWLSRSMFASRGPSGMTFFIGFVSLAIFLLGLMLHLARPIISDFLMGTALSDLFAIDQKLITAKLADFTFLRPMTSPFSRMSMSNFAGVLIALAFGVAVFPQILGRHVSGVSLAPAFASRRVARTTLAVAVFLMFLPFAAVLMRLGVETAIAGGIKSSSLSNSIVYPASLGWISVCGAYTNLAEACAQISGHRGALRLQDVSFDGDALLLAGSFLSNGPSIFWALPFWIAALLVSIVSAHAILQGVLCSARNVKFTHGDESFQLDAKSVVLAIALLISALLVAMLGRQNITELASQGFSLIASAVFPALLLGLYWRRMSAAGAVTAMTIGFAIAFFYIAGSSLLPIQFFEFTGVLSNATAAASRRFIDLQNAYAAAPEGDAKSAAYNVLLQHVMPLANWFGLQKAAIALIAVPTGFVSGLIASMLSKAPSSGD